MPITMHMWGVSCFIGAPTIYTCHSCSLFFFWLCPVGFLHCENVRGLDMGLWMKVILFSHSVWILITLAAEIVCVWSGRVAVPDPLDMLRNTRCAYKHRIFFFHGTTAPRGPGLSHYRGFTITLSHTTLGRTLWTSDQFHTEASTWQHTTLTTSMPPAGFELATPADSRLRLRGHSHRLHRITFLKPEQFGILIPRISEKRMYTCTLIRRCTRGCW